MKKLLAILVLVLFGTLAYAQNWSPGPANIWNVNTGFVGINNGGAVFTPTDLFHVNNNTGSANFRLTRPLSPLSNNTIGSFRIMNTSAVPAEASYFNFSFRYQNGNHEVVQSGFDAPTNSFKAFSYFAIGSGRYEIRSGVSTMQFANSGDVLFENGGRIGVGVGMGTSTGWADAKLAVAGKVVCREIEVRLTGLPDYVFNNDYKLRSLYDVENFINKNKHLPDVPSASEVSENGLNLGDMNATLLQKVEELTLYMIQLKKENDALNARLSKLEK